jgi:hypothetical protein
MKASVLAACAFTFATVLTACGGSGSSSPPATGALSVQVVDAPLDTSLIDRVCIRFTAITVHYAGQPDVRIDYDPLPSQVTPATHCTQGWDGVAPVPPVRLDALSGALSVALVDSQQVPVGRIPWIRLHFDTGSYVTDSMGGEFPLACPSCELTDNTAGRGFKLNRTFEMTSSGLALTVDIDLLKSLHGDAGGYVLRPTARIEVNSSLGTIAGGVATDLLTLLGGELYAGGDTDTNCAVYVFPDDSTDPDDFHYSGSNVVSTAHVRYTTDNAMFDYAYAAGALPVADNGDPLNYRVALTCNDDDPLDDDMVDLVEFTDLQQVTVTAGQSATADFEL